MQLSSTEKLEENYEQIKNYLLTTIHRPENTDSSIKLNNISYIYPNSNTNAINNLSLNIDVGSRIAFVGGTGSGKTTLVDLIIGLLVPSGGILESSLGKPRCP